MAATTSLLVFLFVISGVLLYADAIPQGYQTRHARAQKCPKCPRDCSDKLAGAQVHVVYATAQPAQQVDPAQQYATAAVAPLAAQPTYSPHPTPASYVTPAPPQLQAQYPDPSVQPYQLTARAYQPAAEPYQSPAPAYPPPAAPYQLPQAPAQPYQRAYQPSSHHQYIPPPSLAYNYPYGDLPNNYLPDPYDYPSGYDCEDGLCRCGRSLASNDNYAPFRKYNRRSLDAADDKRKELATKPLPFADESAPPADFYRNYKPYVRDLDRSDEESEERPSRRGPGRRERERLFVVYRADEFDDKPSDSELESVIRQAMDVARQQRTQENAARNGRKAKPYRYRYEHEKQPANERFDFKPVNDGKSSADTTTQRFNLAPGPLMSVDESFVAEDGDDKLNPGQDQSKWTVVPSLSEMELIKSSDRSDVADEIEAAVSVPADLTKIDKSLDIVDGNKDKSKKEAIDVIRAEENQRKSEQVKEMIENMPTPSTASETTYSEKPAETTTVASAQSITSS